MLIRFDDPKTALYTYFNHYLDTLDQSLNIAVLGNKHKGTGVGKSFTCMKIACGIEPGWDLRKLVYYPKEFLQVQDVIESEIKKGQHQACLVDEGYLTAPNNLFYSFGNRAIAYSLATNRYLNCLNLWALPHLAWLDSKARFLIDHVAYCEKYAVDTYENNERLRKPIVKARVYRWLKDELTAKPYRESIRMYNAQTSQACIFKSFKVGLLENKELIEAYEKKSREFKKGMRAGLTKTTLELEEYESQHEDDGVEDYNKVALSALDDTLIRDILTNKGKIPVSLIKSAVRAKESPLYGMRLSNYSQHKITKLINQLWGNKNG